jgi:hypothetical protein
MSEVSLLTGLVRCSLEIVNFALEGRTTISTTTTTNNSITPAALQLHVSQVLQHYLRHFDPGVYRDEVCGVQWPRPLDPLLLHIYMCFHRNVVLEDGRSLAQALPRGWLGGSINTSTSISASSMSVWSEEALRYQLTFLYVIVLRFVCGLRGVKVSQLLGNVLLDLVDTLSGHGGNNNSNNNSNSNSSEDAGDICDWKQVCIFTIRITCIHLHALHTCVIVTT